MNIICRRFHIKTPLIFGKCVHDICKMFVYKHSEITEYVEKLAYFLRNLQT